PRQRRTTRNRIKPSPGGSVWTEGGAGGRGFNYNPPPTAGGLPNLRISQLPAPTSLPGSPLDTARAPPARPAAGAKRELRVGVELPGQRGTLLASPPVHCRRRDSLHCLAGW